MLCKSLILLKCREVSWHRRHCTAFGSYALFVVGHFNRKNRLKLISYYIFANWKSNKVLKTNKSTKLSKPKTYLSNKFNVLTCMPFKFITILGFYTHNFHTTSMAVIKNANSNLIHLTKISRQIFKIWFEQKNKSFWPWRTSFAPPIFSLSWRLWWTLIKLTTVLPDHQFLIL